MDGYMKKIKYTTLGFTLLELLIVISILGSLAVLVINSVPAAGRRARDAQRRSDIKQYQTTLEVYYDNNSSYYIRLSPTKPSTLCSIFGLSSCPDDPKDSSNICSGGVCQYQYVTNGTGSMYALWARLESPATLSPLAPYFIACSDGRTYESATVPSSSNPCP
jgi:prepilin-type N-terminal cleavage/methylation domain-containing protein